MESKNDRQNIAIFDKLNRNVNKRINEKADIHSNCGYLLLLISWVESVTNTSNSKDILWLSGILFNLCPYMAYQSGDTACSFM